MSLDMLIDVREQQDYFQIYWLTLRNLRAIDKWQNQTHIFDIP